MACQLQFLNKVIATKDISLLKLNNFDNSYFPNYVNEYNFIVNHYDRYRCVPDVVTLVDNFPNFKVLNVEDSDAYLVNQLVEEKKERLIAASFNEAKKQSLAGKSADNIVFELYEQLKNEDNRTRTLKCVDIIEEAQVRYDACVEASKNPTQYRIKTGFPELDKIIGGWDRREELAVIVARTNFGKSWILLKSAAAAAEQGLTVGIYSGEMSEFKVGYRIDTLLGHISNGGLTHGNINILNDYKRYIETLSQKVPGKIKVITPELLGSLAGVNDLEMFIEKEHLDILFIDQHSLLEDDRKARNPVEKAANISKDLKSLQVRRKVPLVSVCQQNRQKNDDGSQDTTQIAGTDRIGQDATIVLFLEKKDDVMTLKLGKSRDTENGKSISYHTDLNKGIFEYIPDEKDALNGKTDTDYEHRYDVENDLGEEVF